MAGPSAPFLSQLLLSYTSLVHRKPSAFALSFPRREESTVFRWDWMPAFAGMTEGENLVYNVLDLLSPVSQIPRLSTPA